MMDCGSSSSLVGNTYSLDSNVSRPLMGKITQLYSEGGYLLIFLRLVIIPSKLSIVSRAFPQNMNLNHILTRS